MRTTRLISLLLELTRLRSTTVAQLAARHEVSARTIQRDLAALHQMGVPVWTRTGPAGGVGLVEGWRSPLTGMMAPELQALMLGEAGARELGLETEYQAARMKMLSAPGAAVPGPQAAMAERFHFDHGRWFHEPERPAHLTEISQAVWNGRRITIRYGRTDPDAAPITRRLDPLGLVLKTDRWYLVAAHRRAVKTFRLAKIQGVTVHDQEAWRPERFSLPEHWRKSRAEFEASVVHLPVRLRIPAPSAEALSAALPGTEIDAALGQAQPVGPEAERLEVCLLTESLEIVSVQLLGVPGVEVVEPAELRQALAQRGRDLLAHNAPDESASSFQGYLPPDQRAEGPEHD